MNIWAIGKDGKPLTVGQIRKRLGSNLLFHLDDKEVICAANREIINEWIEDHILADCEPVKIWSGK